MYKAPVCFLLCRNPSPCAASLAGGSKPSSLPILYKSWHRASFMILLPKSYCWCYKIISLNTLLKETSMVISVSPSFYATEAASYRPSSGEAIMGSQKAFSFRLYSKSSLASSSASNLASAFFLRHSATVASFYKHAPGPAPICL